MHADPVVHTAGALPVMKAVVYESARNFAVREIPTPEAGPGQVRIKVGQVGVCGTDLHLHEGEFQAKFPLIPGHEVVGVIESLGAGVDRFSLGEQVTVNPNVACGRCDYCRGGRTILCSSAQGFGTNIPGFFAEYAVVAEDLVFSVEGLAPDVAVFAEPASCAMHGLETIGLRPGSSALVFGAGPTGLLLAQMLASGGASQVTVAAPTQYKLDTAAGLGVDQTVRVERISPENNESIVASLLAASPTGDGYDAVIEATGSTAVGDICVPLTRNGGTVLIYGVTKEADRMSFSPFDVFRREIVIKGSFAEMTSFGAAISALRSGRVGTEGIITHRFPLAQYGEALAAVASDETAHKVVIVP
ncbi:D-arabinitol dehydrogenase (NADP+) [Nakamurella sp. UYEF19]|uniref:zinc-dependent alcohol dehydrogenase family protein n=1 Tax=Nakamurella sp. UYEF19 TaxID=1756392 RepID=UPI00339363CE